MSGFAIDTGSDYSSGGEVGAGTPDVEEEYDDGGSSGGSSGGGSVDVGGGTVVPDSGVTPDENTGTIDLGETGQVEDDLYDDPQSAHESPNFNPDSGPDAGAHIPDADTFPEAPSSNDGMLNADFWNVVINEEGDVLDGSGGAGDILDDLEGPAPIDGGDTPNMPPTVPSPDYDGDGEPGGNLTDRFTEPDWDGDGNPGGPVLGDNEPDWDGDGSPGGNLTDRVPDNVVPDPSEVVSGITATVIGAVIVAYFIGSRGTGA